MTASEWSLEVGLISYFFIFLESLQTSEQLSSHMNCVTLGPTALHSVSCTFLSGCTSCSQHWEQLQALELDTWVVHDFF